MADHQHARVGSPCRYSSSSASSRSKPSASESSSWARCSARGRPAARCRARAPSGSCSRRRTRSEPGQPFARGDRLPLAARRQLALGVGLGLVGDGLSVTEEPELRRHRGVNDTCPVRRIQLVRADRRPGVALAGRRGPADAVLAGPSRCLDAQPVDAALGGVEPPQPRASAARPCGALDRHLRDPALRADQPPQHVGRPVALDRERVRERAVGRLALAVGAAGRSRSRGSGSPPRAAGRRASGTARTAPRAG